MAKPQPDPAHDSISPAEARVLAELLRGQSNKAIAAALVLSRRTIESHVSSLLGKTGCRSRTELLLWALEADRAGGDTMPAADRRINA
ncbi:MAG: helix-turn-helix transcriptional regulator [Cyanobacteriota bacterium]|jgi:DNA-binding NarL/FixJ family response regulator|nr:helix-turn-helix transcriptional regulator [Cyanobacteriota bacterium]